MTGCAVCGKPTSDPRAKRCWECWSSARFYWTPDRIVESIVAWAEQHGRPPAAGDWSTSAPDHPNAANVTTRFGTWNAGIAAAGLEPRPAKRLGVRWAA